jgi:hypothetical protein
MSMSSLSYSQDSGEQSFVHVVATVTASGSTVIYTPASGKRIQLRWIYAIQDPSTGVNPLIRVFLGSDEKFRVYALSKRQFCLGPVNGTLSITLDKPGAVAVTALLLEV